jgi:hypothetical protein
MNDLDNLNDSYKQYFNTLMPKYQKFIIYRGRGITLEKAWTSAGLYARSQTNAKASASSWLKNNPDAKELIKQLQTQAQLKQLNDVSSPLCKEIMTNAEKSLTALDIVKTKKGEDANSMMFYINVMNGAITAKEKTTTTDSEGNEVVKVVEKEPTISERMKAREKLDQMLGISQTADMQIELPNNMKITFVDTSDKGAVRDDHDIIDVECEEGNEVDTSN